MSHRSLRGFATALLASLYLSGVAVADEREADQRVVPIDVSAFAGAAPSDAIAQRSRTILLNANKYALTTWWTAKYGGQGAATYLDLGGITEHLIRPPAMEAYGLAASLWTGAYDAAVTGVSRTDAETKVDTLVRSIAKAHRVNSAGGWGRGCTGATVWQSTLWAAQAGMAGWLRWSTLSATDREYVRKMVECEANSLNTYAVPYYRDANGTIVYPGDSKGEENSWNAMVLQLATAMMPAHANWSIWQRKNVQLMLSSFAAPADLASAAIRHGRKMRSWVDGSNVNADGTLVNHGPVQPDYMTTIEHNWHAFLTTRLSGDDAPLSASWNGDLVYGAMSTVNFSSPPNAAPGGTIYKPGTGAIYYPGDTGSGSNFGLSRRAPYVLMDLQADVFGYDAGLTYDAPYWEALHGQDQLDLQARGTDGRTYQSTAEDAYIGAEELVAWLTGMGYLTKWLQAQGPYTTTNAPYPSSNGTIVDNADAGFTVAAGTWGTASPAHERHYLADRRQHAAGSGAAVARFTPNLPVAARYDVFAWFDGAPGHASNAPYTITPSGGSAVTVTVDQRRGGRWVHLGAFDLPAGTGSRVEVSDAANGTVVADAVRFDPEPYDGSACHTGCAAFGSTQSYNWTYQDLRVSWTNIATFSPTSYFTSYPSGPEWHDVSPSVGGWVTRRAIHPGQSIDTARTWTAQRPGTIDITSHPAKIDPGGDGVVVRVLRNGTTILGPRTIAGGDVTGDAFDATAVPVATGDKIRFVINRNGTYNHDLTHWDPEIRYTPPPTCALACQGFGGTQGADGWRYQDQVAGVWGDIATFHAASPYPDGPTWHDVTPAIGGWVYGHYIHPGQANDTARTWIAPRAGVVDIASRPAKADPGGDGVVVRITKNGTTITGPRTIAAADMTGSAFNAAGVAVAAGDAIRFEINRNGAYNYDLTAWDPQIDYRP